MESIPVKRKRTEADDEIIDDEERCQKCSCGSASVWTVHRNIGYQRKTTLSSAITTHMRYCGSAILILLSVLSSVLVVHAYNIETDIPIIKRGPKGSYFGYAVAQHQQVNRNGRITRNMVVVGAPRATSHLYPGQSGVERPGAVYSCPTDTRRPDDCQYLTFIDDELRNPLPEEIREDQWLGVTVESQGTGGYVVTCAHRYQRNISSDNLGWGICYSLTQQLDYDQPYEACRGRLIDWPGYRPHQLHGYCQSGTSATVAKDNTVAFGLPGTYTARGSVSLNMLGIGADNTWFESPLPQSPTGESLLAYYSYMGMSLVSGYFLPGSDGGEAHQLSYVSGAPRSRDVGQVVFLSKNASRTTVLTVQLVLTGDQNFSSYGHALQGIDINGDNLQDLVVGAPFYVGRKSEHDVTESKAVRGGAIYLYMNSRQGITSTQKPIKLTGVRLSRFGFALANMGDVNHDGYNDLAVGAPYEGETGCVYIYHGSKGGIVPTPAQRIEGVGQDVVGFGSALSAGLDVDDNGYPDLVVGSYQSDLVTVLRSRPVIHIHYTALPTAAIDPTHLCYPQNRGCFEVEPCFTYTAHPDNRYRERIRIRYEMVAEKFRGGAGRGKIPRVWFERKPSRSLAADGSVMEQPSEDYIVRREVELYPQTLRKERCGVKEKLWIKSDNKDILNPIEFKISVSLILDDPADLLSRQSRQSRRPRQSSSPGQHVLDLDKYPVLNNDTAQIYFKVDWLKECGDDKECRSDMKLSALFDLPNDTDFNLPTLTVGHYEQITVSTTISNVGESAYDARLFILYDALLDFDRDMVSDGVGIITLQNQCEHYNLTLLVCQLGNPMQANIDAQVQVIFLTHRLTPTTKDLNVHVWVNSTSTEINPSDNQRHLHAKVIVRADVAIVKGKSDPEQIVYGRPGEHRVRGSSDMSSEEDVGPALNQTYYIVNKGPGDVGRSSVIISWPYELEVGAHGAHSGAHEPHSGAPHPHYPGQRHGKYVLYLVETPLLEIEDSSGVEECETLPGQVNPLNLTILEQPELDARTASLLSSQSSSPSSQGITTRHQQRSKTSSLGKNHAAAHRGGSKFTSNDDWPSPHSSSDSSSDKKRSQRSKRNLPDSDSDSNSDSDRRQVTASAAAANTAAYTKENVAVLDCQRGTARCFKFRCHISELKKGKSAFVRVRARLWATTFIQEYARVDRVEVVTRAQIEIDPALNVHQQNTSNDEYLIKTIAIPEVDIVSETVRLELWIIVVAVCGGLFVFVILVLILWKLGFFARKSVNSYYDMTGGGGGSTRQYHQASRVKAPLPRGYDENNL